MATITITYTKPVDASVVPAAQICATYVPSNAAADWTTGGIPGSYYDTNVPGYGAGMSAEEFFFKQIAHPGLVAALRAAMRAYVPAQPAQGETPATPATPGTYDWTCTDDEALYAIQEVGPALAGQGFAIAAK